MLASGTEYAKAMGLQIGAVEMVAVATRETVPA
jgi:hypothetical protein